MGRKYRLSKAVTEQQASEILREIEELPDVKTVEMTEDGHALAVETKDDVFGDVMSATVNICSRVGDGCELSFNGFIQKES